MDYHIDRRLKLVTEVEHSSLYKWCIQELGEDGELVGRDQIPWAWSHDFSVHDLTYRMSLESERESFHANLKYKEGNEEGFENQEPKVPEVKDAENIVGTLRPSYRPDRFPSQTQYSMFGTDRIIDTFTLRIMPSDKDEELAAWGSVSFTAEVDFREEIEPDCVEFYLSISQERFDKLGELVRSGKVNGASLCMCYVRGFYADWSPSASTNKVKVLCMGSEQEVEIPEGCAIEPPRLGKIGEFSFHLQNKLQFNVPEDLDWEDDEEDFDVLNAEDQKKGTDPAVLELAGLQTTLKALKHPLWAIFAALLLILFNLV